MIPEKSDILDIFENKKNKLLGGLKNEMDIYC